MNKNNHRDISPSQQSYIHHCLMHHYMIVFSRIALFVLFIIMWETGARTGSIDAFIFSSPSRIAATLISMCRSGDIFIHTGITLAETLLSFILVLTAGILLAILLWASDTVSGRNTRTIPCNTEQPAKVCTCSCSHCMAWQQPKDNYSDCHFNRCIRYNN